MPPVVTAPLILVCNIPQFAPTVARAPAGEASTEQIIVSPASTTTPETPPILPATEIL